MVDKDIASNPENVYASFVSISMQIFPFFP